MGIEEEKKKEIKGYIPEFVHTVYNYTKKKKRYWPSKESDRFSKTLSYPAAFFKKQ